MHAYVAYGPYVLVNLSCLLKFCSFVLLDLSGMWCTQGGSTVHGKHVMNKCTITSATAIESFSRRQRMNTLSCAPRKKSNHEVVVRVYVELG